MKTISIGRSQDNDVVLGESNISRHHCQLIQYDDGKVAICDNGSTNGTFVNGERINGKRFLRMTDEVRLGNSIFHWSSYMQTTVDYGNPYEARTEFVSSNYHGRQHSNPGSAYNPNININIQNNNTNNANQNESRSHYQNEPEQRSSAPAIKLRTNRSMLAYIFLSLITLGIYGLVVMSHISTEINHIATKHDGRNTVHYCLMVFLLSWLTLGIYPLIWYSQICSRMGNELVRRGIPYNFGAGHFWGWYIIGSLILIGPLVFYHNFFTAMNKLCEDYNKRG